MTNDIFDEMCNYHYHRFENISVKSITFHLLKTLIKRINYIEHLILHRFIIRKIKNSRIGTIHPH